LAAWQLKPVARLKADFSTFLTSSHSRHLDDGGRWGSGPADYGSKVNISKALQGIPETNLGNLELDESSCFHTLYVNPYHPIIDIVVFFVVVCCSHISNLFEHRSSCEAQCLGHQPATEGARRRLAKFQGMGHGGYGGYLWIWDIHGFSIGSGCGWLRFTTHPNIGVGEQRTNITNEPVWLFRQSLRGPSFDPSSHGDASIE